MKKISKPTYTVEDVLDLLIPTIRDEDFRNRYTSSKALIVAAESNYDSKGAESELYVIEEADSIGGVSSQEASNFYTNSFIRKTGPTRHIYDALRLGAPNNICPFCNHRVVKTLDHHLLKAFHPALTVTPLNLVPACRDCNLDLPIRRPRLSSEQVLHPYYHDVDDGVWLKSEIVEGRPPTVKFFVEPPIAWPEVKKAMVRNHFEVFKLSELYSIHAGVELIPTYSELKRLAEKGGDLKQHLLEKSEDRRASGLNTWQAALFQGLAESDWFCNVGYQYIH